MARALRPKRHRLAGFQSQRRAEMVAPKEGHLLEVVAHCFLLRHPFMVHVSEGFAAFGLQGSKMQAHLRMVVSTGDEGKKAYAPTILLSISTSRTMNTSILPLLQRVDSSLSYIITCGHIILPSLVASSGPV